MRELMPPQLREGESREAAELRWIKRILAALILSSEGGQLVVSRRHLSKVEDTNERQALFEDRDSSGNVVLRFGSKHSAVYPVENEGAWKNQPATTQVTVDTTPPTQPEVLPQSAPPKTPAAVAALENRLRKMELAHSIAKETIRREREKRLSLEDMIENLPPELTPQGQRQRS